jgi:hypothetical protein
VVEVGIGVGVVALWEEFGDLGGGRGLGIEEAEETDGVEDG